MCKPICACTITLPDKLQNICKSLSRFESEWKSPRDEESNPVLHMRFETVRRTADLPYNKCSQRTLKPVVKHFELKCIHFIFIGNHRPDHHKYLYNSS